MIMNLSFLKNHYVNVVIDEQKKKAKIYKTGWVYNPKIVYPAHDCALRFFPQSAGSLTTCQAARR